MLGVEGQGGVHRLVIGAGEREPGVGQVAHLILAVGDLDESLGGEFGERPDLRRGDDADQRAAYRVGHRKK